MQVKTFLDETLPKALFKAKQELGKDIVILESKDVINHPSHPGKRMVRVVVGHENEKNIKEWMPPKVDSPKSKAKTNVFSGLTSKKKASKQSQFNPAKKEEKKENQFNDLIGDILTRKPQQFEQEKEILNEISLLRKEIGELNRKSTKTIQPSETPVKFPDEYAHIEEMLKDKGVQDDLAYSLINQAFLLLEGQRKPEKDKITDIVKNEMSTMLQPYDFKRQMTSSKQKIILLVGPTGVGKTTMAMKLAAHPEIYGKKKVTVISTDPYGPSEALKAFSRMSDTTVFEEKDIDQTETLLEKYKTSDVIIVDTPGKSPFAPNEINKLETYINILKPTDIFLVLSVGSDLKDLVLLCANYLLLKPTGIAFTKFDETTQPGKVFSILDIINLPVTCFGDGKRIFIDIAKGNPQYMFDKLFDTEIKDA